jgi:branched-chain amino acid transport system substrate-binding protein
VTVVCLALLAGCSSAGKGGAGAGGGSATAPIPAGDIVFGETLPLSGPLGQTGTFEKFSVDTVVSELNASGGIAGHQVKVLTLDDKGDPATALANAETLIQTDKVAAVLNGSLGAGSALTVPYFMKVGVPTVLAESNTDFLDVSKYPSYFTSYASAAQYATEYVTFAKDHQLNDLGTLSDGSPIANQASQQVAAQAPAAGLKVTAAVTYSPTAVDLTTQMLQLKNAGTKVVVLDGFAAVAHVYGALKQIGWSPVVMGVGVTTATPQSVGALASQSYYPCTYYYTAQGGQPSGPAKAVIDKMVPQFGVSLTSSGVLGWYDILNTLKAGIEKAHSLSYGAVVKAIESGQPIPSVWPDISYRYTAGNHEGWPDGALKLCTFSPLSGGGVGIAASQ